VSVDFSYQNDTLLLKEIIVILESDEKKKEVLMLVLKSFDAESRGDLHTLDVVTVPDRFQKGISEAEIEQVLDRLFTKGSGLFWRAGINPLTIRK
jgi:hypothetical protein